MILEEISDHQSDGTYITVDDGFIIIRGGNNYPKKTTRGWELLTQIKEEFSEWVPLKDLKESNPVELAKYEVKNKY